MICSGVENRLLAISNLQFLQILSQYLDQFSGVRSQATIRFSESINTYRDPFIYPEGTKFYFISTAAQPGTSSASKENLWMMEVQGEG